MNKNMSGLLGFLTFLEYRSLIFGKCSISGLSVWPLTTFPLYSLGVPLNFHASLVHRNAMLMGYYKHCANEPARNHGRHACVYIFSAPLTCSTDH